LLAFSDSTGTSGTVITVEANAGANAGAWLADRDSVAFSSETGGGPPQPQSVFISNSSVTSASVTVTSDAGWLSAPASISVPGILTLSAQANTLVEGQYTGSVTISAAGVTAPPLSIPVSWTVTAPPPLGPSRALMSQIADGAGWKTTISLVNTDTIPAFFQLNFWNDDGTAMQLPLASGGTVTQYSDTIPLGGSRTINTGEGTSLLQGWAELVTSRSIGGLAIFRQRRPGSPDFEAASTLGPNANGSLLAPFDNTQSFVTSMALVNPASQTARVSVNIRDENGVILSSSNISLPPRGHTGFALPSQFPASANRRGLAEFSTSDSPLAGLGLRFNPGGAFTSLPVTTNRDLSAPIGRRIIAQVADGQNWKTTLSLVNGDSAFGTAKVNFYQGTGDPLGLVFDQIGSGTSVVSKVPSVGAISYSTSGVSANLAQGWAELSGSQGFRGEAIFRQSAPGRPDFEAASPIMTSVSSDFLLPFDNTQGYVTSVALVNPNQAATITMSIRDENGVPISSSTLRLPAGGQTAFVLKDQISGAANRRGVAEFSCPTGLTGLGLRFSPGGAFTSLPILAR
jgi:hypothetical protein